ncbi:hypothetical protein BgiBS90_018559 [Biomphalaria glabrata]|nr:hypothetical protein BgiBS90_018559 [Biomphalaria glabrata]
MSMRTRIRGFTAWVNLRLMPYNQLMSNVLMDLLLGTSMKHLMESITGTSIKRLDSMDGLSPQQIQTRINWAIEELKKCEILPNDVYVDSRLFAMRNADHVFELLWRLICHDIWFLWERYEYLQHDDPQIITQVPFKWTPDPPPKVQRKDLKKSLLSGFGSSALVPPGQSNVENSTWIKFEKSEFMKNFKAKMLEKEKYPEPEACILEIVNNQLKKTNEAKRIFCSCLDDLVDSRILCALLNSFVPDTFITKLLLNDRWTVNLVLETAEKMFYIDTPFDSEDLVEADGMAIASYFTFFFMVAFKYRQCHIVAKMVDKIEKMCKKLGQELADCPRIASNAQELQKRKDLKSQIENLKKELKSLSERFDIKYCQKWVKHVHCIQSEVKKKFEKMLRKKFDSVTVPRNITIHDLCLSCMINLSLTNGSGFYLSEEPESISDGRRLILKHKESLEFLDDQIPKDKLQIKKLLGISDMHQVIVNPRNHPKYEFYFEALSKNKYLKAGSVFLYQVFPTDLLNWHRIFIKEIKDNEMESISKITDFFKDSSFLNKNDSKTGHTALHVAAKCGHLEIVQLLLEHGADINAKNNLQSSPIFYSIEGGHKEVSHLLIEWGCDVHVKNLKGLGPFDVAKSTDLKLFLADLYDFYSSIVPVIMKGNEEFMEDVIQDHLTGQRTFCSLRSRCINGSTLLHTASYFGFVKIIQSLLQLDVDVNVRDYKGATPLHRTRDCKTMMLLLEKGADIESEDSEGNTCLHINCYGDTNTPTNMDCIKLLVDKEASFLKRNKKNLLPIHCCVMQGRVDAIDLLLSYDTDKSIFKALFDDTNRSLPSLPFLALANNFIPCAVWLLKKGFGFKAKEQDNLLLNILTHRMKIFPLKQVVEVLLQNGADPNLIYLDGNMSLHHAVKSNSLTDIVELLLSYGAVIDSPNNDGISPLMMACKANNIIAAKILIQNGAAIKSRNIRNLSAFDFISDYEEWIGSGYFSNDIVSKLKACSFKQTRELIQTISKRVKSASVASSPFQLSGRTIRSAPPSHLSYRPLQSAPGSRRSKKSLPSAHHQSRTRSLSAKSYHSLESLWPAVLYNANV